MKASSDTGLNEKHKNHEKNMRAKATSSPRSWGSPMVSQGAGSVSTQLRSG